MSANIRATVIGAGSAAFSLRMIGDMCLTEGLRGSTVCLMDIDEARVDMVHNLAARYVDELGADVRFEKTTDRERALKDADFVLNTAAPEDNFGWLAGVFVGKAKEALTFHLRYIYRVVEKDAVLGIVTDSDFIGGGTDGKGHEGNFSFMITKHVGVGASYFYNSRTLDEPSSYHRVQLDTKVKF